MADDDHVDLPAMMGQVTMRPEEITRNKVTVVGDDMIQLSVGAHHQTNFQLILAPEGTEQLIERLECALLEARTDE